MNIILSSIILFLGINTSSQLIEPQNTNDRTYVKTRTIGPFAIGQDHPHTINVRITHAHLGRDEADEWRDSDTLLTVIDTNHRILFRRSAESKLSDESTSFKCVQAAIPTIGNTLMIECRVAPTEPDDGDDIQFFTFNLKGKFVPLTCTIPRASYKIVLLDSRTRKKPILLDSLKPYAKPAVEVSLYTGHFDAKVYYRIYPEGYSKQWSRVLFHFDQIPIIVDLKLLAIWRQQDNKEEHTVALHASPSMSYTKEDGATTSAIHSTTKISGLQKILVKPTSKIQYFYASFLNGWWLYVSIDGHKGYVTDSDSRYLGFPETGGIPEELGSDY